MLLKKQQLNLWFLGLLFYPLLFFTVKLSDFDISFFKIIAIIVASFYIINQILSKKIVLSKILIVFIFLTIFSLIVNEISPRLLLNIVSYFLLIYFAICGNSILKNSSSEEILKCFKKVINIWYVFLFLGFLQLLLSYYGIDLAWESIGEPSPENKGYLFGTYILRPASFYGEPRDLSAFVILIYTLHTFIYKNENINFITLVIFLALGIATQSSTFFMVMFFYLLVIFRASFFKILFAIIILIIALYYLFPLLKSIIPRLYFVEEFNINMLNTPLFAEQAGDLSFIFYVLNSDMLQFLFGNGIGTSSSVISSFTNEYMWTKSDYTFINSRWLFYTWLIDFGFLALLVFTYFINKHLPINEKLKTLSLFSIGTSLFTGSFIFVYIIIIFKYINYETSIK
tara:strand:+ start:1296 stop:2492 length:1197 start_codon:yes stop_codon:yes gene_type:complete